MFENRIFSPVRGVIWVDVMFENRIFSPVRGVIWVDVMLAIRIFSPVRGVIWLFIHEKIAQPSSKFIPDSIILND